MLRARPNSQAYIRAGADVADLASLHEPIERRERFIDRSLRIKAVDLIQIDALDSQAPKAAEPGPWARLCSNA